MSRHTPASLVSSASPLAVALGRRRLLLGFAVVVLIAVVHTMHDTAHGSVPWQSALSSVVMVGQCVVLSIGYPQILRWRAPRWAMLVGGGFVSGAFGILFMGLHADEGRWSPRGIAGSVVVGLSFTALWTLVFQLPALFDRMRLAELEAEALRREAELSRARVHLHPHFLLNTLNAIAGLVTEDAEGARRLIAALGDLVRDALTGGDEQRPFASEVAWLRRYVEILETRHRGFLAFRWEVAEDTMATPVPRLLLQPLVENAVKHGALCTREGGCVLIRSERLEDGTIRFVIEDNGPGIREHFVEGLGISLVRRRLALLCPGGSMRFVPLDVGTRVIVELPTSTEVST